MKNNTLLIVLSLLSILLLSIHVTDDIIHGYDRWGRPSLNGVLILAVMLYGTLALAERRVGLVIMLIAGLGATAMPVIHKGAGAVAKSSGGFFFIWTLFALGAIGPVVIVLAARRLWSLRSGGADGTMAAVANEDPDRRR